MNNSAVNVHLVERRVSTVLGGTLLLGSIMRSSLSGTALAAALLYRGISGHSYLYQVLGVSTVDERQEQREVDSTPEVERSITINKPAAELQSYWREPQKLAQIMGDIVEITAGDEGHIHWVVRGPFGQEIAWDTQIVEDRPGESLRWQSLTGAQIPNEGTIHFQPAPADYGTVATLHFRFDPPGGALSNQIAKRLGIVPSLLVEKALRRFKSLAETGEAPTLKHNPSARVESYA